MAVAKICGIETEYGIIIRGAEESNPITASSTLVNAYVAEVASQPGQGRPNASDRLGLRGRDPGERRPWRFSAAELCTRGRDPSGQRRADQRQPVLRGPRPPRAVDAGMLQCAPRPCCTTGAGEEILIRSMAGAKRLLPGDQEIVVYKNNSDGKGQSYGCHENYMLSRQLPFGRIVTHAHRPLRQPPDLHRCRQGGVRSARHAPPTTCRSS